MVGADVLRLPKARRLTLSRLGGLGEPRPAISLSGIQFPEA